MRWRPAVPTSAGSAPAACIAIENDIPTIVPIILSESGKTVTDVSMLLDGEVVAAKTDGRAIPVDTGRHLLSFRSGNEVLASFETVIVQGQRNRTVEVSLRPGGNALAKSSIPLTAAAPPPEGDPHESASATELASAATESRAASSAGGETDTREREQQRVLQQRGAVTGLAGAAGGSTRTRSRRRRRSTWARARGPRKITLTRDLAGRAAGSWRSPAASSSATAIANGGTERLENCRPNCAQKRVDRIRQIYLGSRVLLGLGAASLVGAGVLYFFSGSGGMLDLAANHSPAPRYGLDVVPAAESGGVAVFSGSF